MNKLTFMFSFFFLFTMSSVAQFSYSDDFESYTVGDYIGSNSAVWSTWSGATGGAEDAQVADVNANASSNSIYFESTATNGGPQDVVLDFGDVFSTGDFVFQSDFYVNQYSGAYFNFQAESVIGTTWALDCHMVDGAISFQNGSTVMLAGAYTQAVWFTMKMEINLTTNNWEVFIDGTSIGSFANGVNQIASIDIFPIQGNQFYVDNISVAHTPYVMPQLNGAMLLINPIEGLVSQERFATTEVKNLGLTTISSFDLVLNYGSTELTESISGVSLTSFDAMTVDFTTPIVLGEGGAALTVSITNINGLGIDDNDASDDSKTIEVNPVIPAEGKVVIAEQGTGTWSGWCPRGTVAMAQMARDFEGFYQGIAIHNGDPMELEAYNQDLGVSGYPSALVDRGTEIDPGDIKLDFMERILVPPTAFITNGAVLDGDSLNVSLTVDFNLAASGNWKIACVLTEDNVSGVSSGYSQTNYYSGGNNGDLVGVDGVNWTDLPGTVSASNMVYHNVARALSPSFAGHAGFPNSIELGSTYTFNFKFAIDENWKTEDMHIVGMVIGTDSKIDNGSSSSIDDAIAAGFVAGTNVLGATELSQFDDVMINPSQGSSGDVLSVTMSGSLPSQYINTNLGYSQYSSTNSLVRFSQYSSTNSFFGSLVEFNLGVYSDYDALMQVAIPQDQEIGVYDIEMRFSGSSNNWILLEHNFEILASIYGCPYPDFIEYNPDYDIADPYLCLTLVVNGCTDPSAFNFNPEANVDNETCVIYGCTNPEADNYNSEATVSDESCIVFGCINPTAENYNSLATNNDGSCLIYGCVLSVFPNYNPEATVDDLSCSFGVLDVFGCTDESALNYYAASNVDNGTCIFNEDGDDCSISIQEEDIPLYLPEGWVLFGYTCLEPLDLSLGFESIVDLVIIVKDSDGNAYLPEWNFNGIGDLIYSRGYQIKTTEEILDFSFCPTITVLEEVSNPQYQVGDLVEGGIVFYIDETGEHGLVAAMEDLGQFEWGCYGTTISGADGQSIGTGYQNTLDIVAGCSETPIAASEALAYESEGYSDWYLPSFDELYEMYNTIGNGGSEGNIGGFSSGYYSSSSDHNNIDAWFVIFNNGYTGYGSKSDLRRVRVIRAF
jgi:hypothetical protein